MIFLPPAAKQLIMKNLILVFFLFFSFCIGAQSNGVAKMAPVLASGYYLNNKGDTIKGQVQTNPPAETDFYSEFFFKAQRSRKPKSMNSKMTKAYGFGGRHFVAADYNGKKLFIERLATGRLNFYEYRYNGKIDGRPAIESYYFIKDTRAEGADAGLRELKKISGMFYKKSLKPYMKDQPYIWRDLDKYNFELQSVIDAVNEFNRLYDIASY